MPLRDLQYEIAGRFDGERTSVGVDFSQDPMVACHEAAHAEVVRYTTDGGVLGTCLLVVNGRCRLSASLKEDYSRLGDALLESSREAHEAVATYMGLAIIPGPIQKRLIDSLPPTYADYHRKLAWLDSVTSSQLLRHTLAWNIALVVFCSPFLSRLVVLGPGGVLPLKESEKSNSRLQKVLEKLQACPPAAIINHFENAAAERCNQLGVPMWNLNDDRAWATRRDTTKLVSEFASTEFRKWIVKNTSIEELQDPERSKAEDAFFAMSREIGINLVDTRPPPEKRNVSTIASEERSAAEMGSRSRLTNPHAKPVSDSDPMMLSQEDVFLGGPCAFAAATLDDGGRGWYLFRWSPGAPEHLPISVHRFPEKVFLEFLSRWRQREAGGLAVPPLLGATVVVNNLSECLSFIRSVPAAPEAMVKRFVWYYLDDWCALIERLTSTEEPVIAMNFGHFDRTPGRSLTELGGIITKILASGKRGGWIYIRSFNARDAAAISSFEQELRKKGRLIPAQPSDKERLGPIIGAATQMVWPLVPEF